MNKFNLKNKQQILFISIVLVLGFSFITILFYLDNMANKKDFAYKFYGVVEQVSYDIKGRPNVTIHDTEYCLCDNNWDFNHRIEKGDTIEKKANTLIVRLKKHNSGEVIFFGNQK